MAVGTITEAIMEVGDTMAAAVTAVVTVAAITDRSSHPGEVTVHVI